jgi:hypothetical protein
LYSASEVLFMLITKMAKGKKIVSYLNYKVFSEIFKA